MDSMVRRLCDGLNYGPVQEAGDVVRGAFAREQLEMG